MGLKNKRLICLPVRLLRQLIMPQLLQGMTNKALKTSDRFMILNLGTPFLPR